MVSLGNELMIFKPVYVGDTIGCFLTIKQTHDPNGSTTEVTYCNQNGTVVLKAELAGILLDGREWNVFAAIRQGDITWDWSWLQIGLMFLMLWRSLLAARRFSACWNGPQK